MVSVTVNACIGPGATKKSPHPCTMIRALIFDFDGLILDTETGSDAEHLYAHMGWVKVGVIPDYAMRPDRSGLRPTSLWYRRLD